MIGGHRHGTLMTITTTGSLDGALGCPEANADQAEGCYGPQPDLLLRMAVVTVDGGPFLAWARVPRATPDPAFLTAFEQMLTTVRFR
jgi:hypothetical protein